MAHSPGRDGALSRGKLDIYIRRQRFPTLRSSDEWHLIWATAGDLPDGRDDLVRNGEIYYVAGLVASLRGAAGLKILCKFLVTFG